MGHAPPHRVRMRQVPEIVGDLLLPTRPDHKVPVILHQTPTDDPQRHPRVRLQHDPHEGGVVFIAAKQSDTPRRTIQNMIYISAGTMTRFSGQAILLAQYRLPVNTSCVPVLFWQRALPSTTIGKAAGGCSRRGVVSTAGNPLDVNSYRKV